MQGRTSLIDQSRHFFLAQDRRQATRRFRVGGLFQTPGLLESFDVEESESRQALPNRGRCQLLFLEKLGLVFANMPRAQAVGGKMESSRKIFNGADVTTYGSLCIITTLEFLQHHFA
jgi:hypothetical protein